MTARAVVLADCAGKGAFGRQRGPAGGVRNLIWSEWRRAAHRW